MKLVKHTLVVPFRNTVGVFGVLRVCVNEANESSWFLEFPGKAPRILNPDETNEALLNYFYQTAK